MSDLITLRVAGRASTKQRPRFDPRTKRTYTPPSNIVSENDVRAVWREAGEPRIEDDCAIELHVVVTVMRPGGHFRKSGSLSTEGLRQPVPRKQKPDLDNAVKLIMDALNSRAYRDDVLVARVSAERRWGDWPETLVTIRPLTGVERAVGGVSERAPVAPAREEPGTASRPLSLDLDHEAAA